MARFTPFSFNQYGELVYRRTGRTAPENYFIKNGTVYRPADNAQGRVKVGQIGKGSAAQREIVSKAATAGGRTAAEIKGRYSFKHIKRARERAIAKEPTLQLQTPKLDPSAVEKFGKSVREMSKFLIGQGNDAEILRQKIERMEDSKLLELYNSNEMVFDVYFDYGGIRKTEKGLVSNQQTAANARALVDVYEKRFGPIAVQARL